MSATPPPSSRSAAVSIGFSIAAGCIVLPLLVCALVLTGLSLLPPHLQEPIADYGLLLGLPLFLLGGVWWLGVLCAVVALLLAVHARARVPTIVASSVLAAGCLFAVLQLIVFPLMGFLP